MKKICLNCHFCDVSFPDVDIRELKEEDDYLICTRTCESEKTYENWTCGAFKKSKGREADLKAGWRDGQ